MTKFRSSGKNARFLSNDTRHSGRVSLSLKLLSCPVTCVTENSVFEDYSPVRSLASLGLLSLKLLSCPVTDVTENPVFENYSPARSLASPGLDRFCDKVS